MNIMPKYTKKDKPKYSPSANYWPGFKRMTQMNEAATTPNGGALAIAYRDPKTLRPDKKNARSHTPQQIAKLRASIREFGFTNPVLVDGLGVIICGHARTRAAIEQGLPSVPVIAMAGLSHSQRQALAIADNRIALDAGWNADVLTEELERLASEDFDLSLTGFDVEELLSFGVGEPDAEPGAKDSKIKEVETGPVVDRFWISVRGLLKDQHVVLARLVEAMKDLPGVDVELGTTPEEE